MQFGSFGYFIGKVFATTIISVILILLAELIMNRRKLKR
jgi:heme exporter protein D